MAAGIGECMAIPAMNELKEKLAALGLSPEQVDGALQVMAEFVKSRVPADCRGAVDTLLAGGEVDWTTLAAGLFGRMKGFF